MLTIKEICLMSLVIVLIVNLTLFVSDFGTSLWFIRVAIGIALNIPMMWWVNRYTWNKYNQEGK